jgi:hypothetical protein
MVTWLFGYIWDMLINVTKDFPQKAYSQGSIRTPLTTPCAIVRGLLEKYPTFGREKETGLLGALDT